MATMPRFSGNARLACGQWPASADNCFGLRPRLVSAASVIGPTAIDRALRQHICRTPWYASLNGGAVRAARRRASLSFEG
jgi:hypothetical protein